MEKYKCNICSRTFINGRALGGHMKAHLSTFLLPSKQLPHRNFSPSSSSSPEKSEQEEVAETDELRVNRKKSFKFADPSRKRSKRKRELQDPSLRKPISDDFPSEPEPASSVSDTSPEENVAMCLILLSRDKWVEKEEEKGKSLMEIKKCRKGFRSRRELWSHKKICLGNEPELKNGVNGRIFECPFCFKVFGSGQALGGHKRSHLTSSANSGKIGLSFIDLNLPAPIEEDDYSVISDA